MKKVLFFCLLISIVSCKQTKEEKLWDAFLEYAKNNIDDPTGCEFVSVDSVEMLSTLDAKRQLTDMYNIYSLMTKKKDSLSYLTTISKQQMKATQITSNWRKLNLTTIKNLLNYLESIKNR